MRRQERSLASELTIVDIVDDVILHKDFSITLLFGVEAFHEPGMSEDDFDRLALEADNAWCVLPEGSSYQFLVIVDEEEGKRRVREACPPIPVQNTRDALLEEFRRSRVDEILRDDDVDRRFVQGRQHFVAATFRPKCLQLGFAQRAMTAAALMAGELRRRLGEWVGRGASGTHYSGVYAKALAEAAVFEKQVTVGLLTMGLTNFHRCHTSEIVSLVYEVLNPTMAAIAPLTALPERLREDPDGAPTSVVERFPFVADASPVWALTDDDALIRRAHLRLGDTYVAVVSLKELPDSTEPGVLVPLLKLARRRYVLSYRVSIPDGALELATLRARKLVADGLRLKDFLVKRSSDADPHADIVAKQSMKAMDRVIASTERVFGVSLRLALFENSPEALDEGVQEVLGAMSRAHGLRGIRETYALRENFFAMLPGAPECVERRRRALTPYMVDMLPYWDFRMGRGKVVFCTPHNSLVRMDPFDKDMQPNPSILVTGEPGSGKSYVVNYLLSGYELGAHSAGEPPPYTFILDNGRSYERYMELRPDGRYVRFSGERPPRFAPFRWNEEWGTLDDHLGRLEELISDLLDIDDRAHDTKGVVEKALALQYAPASQHPRTIQGFAAALEAVDPAARATLDGALYPFLKGKCRRLFADEADETLSEGVRAVCYDFQGLEGSKILASVALKLVVYEVRRWSARMSQQGHRTFLVLDESWAMLDAGTGGARVTATAAPFLAATIRMGRKEGMSVVALSQSITDFASSSYGHAVLSCAATKIVGTPGSDLEGVRKHLQLNDRQVEHIKKLRKTPRYHDFLLIRGEHSDVIRVPADRFSRWVFTTAPQHRDRLAGLANERPDLPLLDRIRLLASEA
jgi:hypothetical protein